MGENPLNHNFIAYMEDETINVNEDTLNFELNEDTSIDVDSVEDSQDEVARLKELNARLFERAKKAEGFEKTPDGKWIKKSNQLTTKKETQPHKKFEEPDLTSRLSNLELLEKKRQFGYENNLSPEETDAIFKINPNPSKDDLENPFVKGGIEALRAKRRVAENTPSSSSKSVIFKGKDIKQVFTDEKMSKEDKQNAWAKLTGMAK